MAFELWSRDGTLLKAWKIMLLLIIADCHLSWSGCGEVCRVVWFYSKGSSETLLSPCYDPPGSYSQTEHVPAPRGGPSAHEYTPVPIQCAHACLCWNGSSVNIHILKFVINIKRLCFLQRAMANSCIIYDYIRNLDFCLQVLYEMCKIRWRE